MSFASEPGILDEVLLLDEPAEVLLVDEQARQGLDAALQLKKGEGLRQHLENHRAVFDLGTQPGDAGGEDAAVVACHRLTEKDGIDVHRSSCLGQQRRLEQQFVALQHELLVPTVFLQAEGDGAALGADAACRGVASRGDPALQRRLQGCFRSPRGRRRSSQGKNAYQFRHSGSPSRSGTFGSGRSRVRPR